MEETPHKQSFLHGGLGMLTADGIAKSGFYAISLLDYLGDEVISRGKGHAYVNGC